MNADPSEFPENKYEAEWTFRPYITVRRKKTGEFEIEGDWSDCGDVDVYLWPTNETVSATHPSVVEDTKLAETWLNQYIERWGLHGEW